MRDLSTDRSPRRPLPPVSDHVHATRELPGGVESVRITVELPGRQPLAQEFPVSACHALEIACLPAVEATCEARVSVETPGRPPIVQTLLVLQGECLVFQLGARPAAGGDEREAVPPPPESPSQGV